MMAGQDASAPVNYHNEIKCMMYTFGDVKTPCVESVSLVEHLARSQISEIVVKASEVARLRNDDWVVVEDVLFLLRKNISKLKLVLQHLQHLEKSKRTTSSSASEDEESFDITSPPEKKSKYSLDFLSPKDQAIVDSEEKSEVVLQRLEAMDKITAGMDATEYMHYTSCRQVNFLKNTSKFIAWLKLDSISDLTWKQNAIEVMGLLVHEIIREITELSLQVKEDMEVGRSLKAPRTSKVHQLHLLQPPPLPSGSSPLPAHEPSPTSSPLPTSQDTSRERLDSSGSRSATTGQMEREGRTEEETRKSKSRPKALQPRHIREAFRRYMYTHSPLVPLSTHFSGNSFYRHNLCT